jgi:hypothetical protein
VTFNYSFIDRSENTRVYKLQVRREENMSITNISTQKYFIFLLNIQYIASSF